MKVSHRITRLVLIAPRRPRPRRPRRERPAARRTRHARPDRDPAEPPVVQSVDNGFDWASAAIGAGLAGGIVLLIVWGGVTYRHRHEHIGVAH